MRLNKRIAFGTFANWMSRLVSILFGLLLIPVMFRKLDQEEIGVWMLLGQLWAILGVMDFGLTATLTRRIALAKGKCGADVDCLLSEEPRRQIADLVESGRKLYRYLAVGSFVASVIPGYFMIGRLDLNTVQFSTAWAAWVVLCASYSIGLWASVWSCVLQGMGYVGWNSVIAAAITSLTLLAQLIVVFAGGGLVGLAISAAIGALLQRSVFVRFARARTPGLFAVNGAWDPLAVKSMVAPALLSWVTGFGFAVTMHTDQLFIAHLGRTAEIPPYRAAYLIMMNLTLLSAAIAGSSSVFISQLWQAGELDKLRNVVKQSLRISLIIMACGGACVLALGPALFELWLGPGNFVGYPILVVFLITLTMEVQSHAFSTCSRATEDEVFLFCAFVSAVIKVFLAFILGIYYGLLGIALSTMVAQLLTSNWYMVYRPIHRLGLSFFSYVRDIAIPVLIVFGVTSGMVHGVKFMFRLSPLWVEVGSGVVCAGLVMVLALWLLALNFNQRIGILARIGIAVRGGKVNI
jgi:O-antigen/teichoic acid export membrane protein